MKCACAYPFSWAGRFDAAGLVVALPACRDHCGEQLSACAELNPTGPQTKRCFHPSGEEARCWRVSHLFQGPARSRCTQVGAHPARGTTTRKGSLTWQVGWAAGPEPSPLLSLRRGRAPWAAQLGALLVHTSLHLHPDVACLRRSHTAAAALAAPPRTCTRPSAPAVLASHTRAARASRSQAAARQRAGQACRAQHRRPSHQHAAPAWRMR